MSIEKDILDGLEDFRDAALAGNISSKLTCRKVRLTLKPSDYDPALVKKTRKLLNVSQAVFAEFIGVSLNTLQAWEQGTNPVTGAAARLMDEIRRDPAYWTSRLQESVQVT